MSAPANPPAAGHIPGMTLRDIFAAHAMAGMLADPAYSLTPAAGARIAYGLADAMIEHRRQGGGA